MERVPYVNIRDLVGLTGKTIEDTLVPALTGKVEAFKKEITENEMSGARVTEILDALFAFQPLRDTISAVRPSINNGQALLVLCNSILQLMQHGKAQNPVSAPQQKGASGNYVRQPGKDEKDAWELIQKS